MQSRSMSLAEASANIAAGYLIAVATTAIVLPIFGYEVTPTDAAGISAVFTAVSLARSYAIRRLFNGWAHGW